MLYALMLLVGLAHAGVEAPTRAPDKVVTTDLSSGEVLTDLGWAQSSAVACLPSTRWKYIQGSTVFLDEKVPAGKTAYVRATPTSEFDLAVYVFVDPKSGLGASVEGLRPPKITSARNCAKSYWQKPGVAETVEIAARPEAQTLVIAVAGAKDVTAGSYTLEIWFE